MANPMKVSELRNLTEVELNKQLLDIRDEQLRNRVGRVTSPFSGIAPVAVGQIKILRRTVARIKTLLTEKKSGGAV